MTAQSSAFSSERNSYETKRFDHQTKSAKGRIQMMVSFSYFCSLRKITLQDDAERYFND